MTFFCFALFWFYFIFFPVFHLIPLSLSFLCDCVFGDYYYCYYDRLSTKDFFVLFLFAFIFCLLDIIHSFNACFALCKMSFYTRLFVKSSMCLLVFLFLIVSCFYLILWCVFHCILWIHLDKGCVLWVFYLLRLFAFPGATTISSSARYHQNIVSSIAIMRTMIFEFFKASKTVHLIINY